MKLITAIVNKEDSRAVCNELLKHKFYVTRLATTGGFLMAGNMTLLICTEDEKVDECISVISQFCKQRTEIVPGTTDAAVEKHVPVVKAEGSQVTVTVGAVEHPMLPEHFIEWIVLETQQGSQIKHLKPGEKPQAVFALAEGDQTVAAYAYCNLHGLWKA